MPTKRAVMTYAVGFLLALSITFMSVFNNAVLNGGTTLVDLNRYGEMIPELLLLNFVIWPTISLGLFYLIEADSQDAERE